MVAGLVILSPEEGEGSLLRSFAQDDGRRWLRVDALFFRADDVIALRQLTRYKLRHRILGPHGFDPQYADLLRRMGLPQ